MTAKIVELFREDNEVSKVGPVDEQNRRSSERYSGLASKENNGFIALPQGQRVPIFFTG